MHTTAAASTGERILDVAEELVQTRGLNGMSYADISLRLGITKASLHYHFASKGDLVQALVDRYAERFFRELDFLDESQTDAAARLRGYVRVYGSVLERGRMCLCGMLASDFETLTPQAQADVARFFERNAEWLERVIAVGIREGQLPATGSPRASAETLMAGLEGAMLVSRPFEGTARFDVIASALLTGVGAGDASS
jgi:TetR/AcrR family transcriptional repressor of nem operon